jgi:DNA-binding NarL/FixJ family response regulator
MTGRARKATKSRTKILVVDDHPLFRQGVEDLIRRSLHCQVCGEVDDAPKAMEAIKEKKPDMAIVDMSLAASNGLDLIEEIKVHHPKLPILVLSMHDEKLYAERALRAGARGYVMKGKPVQEIVAAIRRVLDGEIYLSDQMSHRLLERIVSGTPDATRSLIGTLSNRELEVFELIGQGHGTRSIAERLHLSVKTIDTNRESIKRKLGLSDGIELHQQAFLWIQHPPADSKQSSLR